MNKTLKTYKEIKKVLKTKGILAFVQVGPTSSFIQANKSDVLNLICSKERCGIIGPLNGKGEPETVLLNDEKQLMLYYI